MVKKTKKIDLKNSALIIVDVQNDFCPGGALAVSYGDEVVPPLNRMIRLFTKNDRPIYASRDWHPEHTKHFNTNGGKWPPHCIIATKGAEFHPDLEIPSLVIKISKGMSNKDVYSAFDNEMVSSESLVWPEQLSLSEMLLANKIKKLFIGGLATDYCVKATVLDALKLGFKVYLLKDACRAVNLKPTDEADAIKEMIEAGKKAGRGKFKITTTKEVLGK